MPPNKPAKTAAASAAPGGAKKSHGPISIYRVVGIAAVAMAAYFIFNPIDLVCHLRVTVENLWTPAYTYPSFHHHTAEYNSSMLWGSYRPHLYFGMRTRTPQGVLTGILWKGGQSGWRHTAEDGDHVAFGWQLHDGLGFGQQAIKDRENDMDMEVHMVKQPRGSKGGDWAVRFKGHATQPILFAHYIVMEGKEGVKVLDRTEQQVALSSDHPDIGPFSLLVSHGHSGPNATWNIQGKRVSKDPWNVMGPPQFRKELKGDENVIVVSTVLEGDFTVEVVLISHEGYAANAPVTLSDLQQAVQQQGLVGCALAGTIHRRRAAYLTRFDQTFSLRAKGLSTQHIEMAQAGLSNYLGGMGYWYGNGLRFKDGDQPNAGTEPTGINALFSGVPSRSKFPRGFLWDEGFHQLLAARWDEELSKDVLLHWMNLMEPNGWIPREQILGAEPRTRVPSEFVPQTPTHANPPTLTLQIQNFALHNEDGRHSQFLERVWPYLERWFDWFRTSQSGLTNTTFQWRGRKGYHLLACGLDDYPRSVCATETEAHVDLYSWVTLMASTIQSIGTAMGRQTAYGQFADRLLAALDEVHWDDKRKQYSDRTGCSSSPEKPLKSNFLGHFGYVNLFPVLTGIASPETAASVVNRSWELMSGFGLRSLRAKDAKKIGRSDNYWTGPIWINLNYLMLRALHTKYSSIPGALELYQQLRSDLINNILSEFLRTGKLWENYNATTGHGQGTAPFTGWTVLVILIMDEWY